MVWEMKEAKRRSNKLGIGGSRKIEAVKIKDRKAKLEGTEVDKSLLIRAHYLAKSFPGSLSLRPLLLPCIAVKHGGKLYVSSNC